MKANELLKELNEGFYVEERNEIVKSFAKNDSLAHELAKYVHLKMDKMPDDFIYDTIHTIINDAVLNNLSIIGLNEMEMEPDVYNNDLLKWLQSDLYRAEFVNEAVKELGFESMEFDLFKVISWGQWQEMNEIKNHVIDFINEKLEG